MPLVDFLRDGRQLGAVEFGMTADAIRRTLGEPDDVSVRAAPAIWKYGGLQIAFHSPERTTPPTVHFIGLYFGTADRWPDAVRSGGWWPDDDASLETIRQMLDAEGLPATADDDDGLRLSSGVRIAFDGGRLHSIQATDRVRVNRRAVRTVRTTDETIPSSRE